MIGKIYLFICIMTFIMCWIMVYKVLYVICNDYDITKFKSRHKDPFETLVSVLKVIFVSIIPILNITLLYIFLFESNEIVNKAITNLEKDCNLQKKGDNNEQ